MLLQQFETDISQSMFGLNAPMRVPGGRDVIVVAVVTTMPRRRHEAAGVVVVMGAVGARCAGGRRRLALAVLVCFDVLAEVVGPHEAFRADATDESFLAGVGAYVPLQLVRASEPLAAEQPITQERTLARVPAQVRLEVRRLVVHLYTCTSHPHTMFTELYISLFINHQDSIDNK